MSPSTERLAASLSRSYRIERELGAGGMATVYLAHDLKHNRHVAIKVLKPELAAVIGAERFVQEITTTAALSHPHILPLFDSGEADGFLFYVMPFVDGETLRTRLDRDRQLGVDEAVRITVEVADALQYAHEHGVIHRDIKPENILLQGGRPMVADFGIALALSAAAGGRMTETGLSLGTPHYMSPEQATAEKEISARSDVYSLASVLYEMLAGEPPHSGGTAQAIIMKIIAETAQPVTRLRKSVPPNVAAAVAKALEKVPADRFESAKAFAEALGNPAFTSMRFTSGEHAPPSSARTVTATTVLALLAIPALLLAGWGWFRPSPATAPPVIRYRMLGAALNLERDYATNFAVSPDGEVLVWAGSSPAGDRFGLWVQRRSQLEPTPLPGGEDAHQPFFSPDGKKVGFITLSRALRVASLEGAPTVTLVDSGVVRGSGAWGSDGYIYVSVGNTLAGAGLAVPTGIGRLPASGGPLEVVTRRAVERKEVSHHFPEALPGGRGVLFVISIQSEYSAQDSEIAVVDLATGTHHTLLRGVQARWSPTGHILVVQADGRLVAAPFDLKRLELTGSAVPLLEGVRVDALGTADLVLSASGRLIYAAGNYAGPLGAFESVWVGHDGAAVSIDSSWTGLFSNPALSPDGSMMAVQVGARSNTEIWVKQLGNRGPSSRLTFTGQISGSPSWTQDSRFVRFLSVGAAGGPKPYVRRADGSDEPSLVVDIPMEEVDYSHDGRWLVYSDTAGGTTPGVYAWRIGQDTTPTRLMARRFGESELRLSPDGRWLAYSSLETGRREVYVRPFPDATSARWRVSSGGGRAPLWAPDSRELFYQSANYDRVNAARLRSGPEFSIEGERTLFPMGDGVQTLGWDVAADGRRFAMIRIVAGAVGATAREWVVVENFLGELKAKVGQ